MDRGGAETLIMNVYRNLDKTRFQFDFVTHCSDNGDYEHEIEDMGGKIYKISSLGQLGPIAYVSKLIKIMKNQQYIAVHSHTDYQSGFPALAAKIAGIEHRICHSHSTNWLKGERLKDTVILKTLKTVIKFSATKYCSCSKEAADFLFGRSFIKNERVSILKNGIDVNQFSTNKSTCRKEVLKELNLPENAIIIGHVGRFSESKNQGFLLKIMKRLIEEEPRYVALLVGDGPMKQQIAREAEDLGITNQIRFLGVRDDIPTLMSAFDVFLFPSLFEGFGIVTIEAQCAGTACILSDAVPKETDMDLGLVSYINLDGTIEIWCQKVKEALKVKGPEKEVIHKRIEDKGYSIGQNIEEWLSLYGLNAT
ncbi:glycosyltransferase family 1 protein [Mesobacillus foraminis]|uniref:glycosyltransferase family 1 protein n=1 Tax=Mesobacillus foraminis TaxID=279826 RepID=UPI001BE809B4|nr:glycosyltransferase family 1 protein [Mesobacillus foraminis]MBT2758417.1 glycosyltransferase family 1 protein [Mesobacillus foraminis]